ncbi:MAG: MBL fold metallo-hydrolase [Defluviitaleaceae bacterium]|nr:MBL fold metallo-hydrolase [Defluviitaleaceae bacterium]
MKLKVYGCRGSIPFCQNSQYGGNTACIALESKGQIIFLDAGSGIINFDLSEDWYKDSTIKNKYFDIFLSHLHIDHILGLATFKYLWDPQSHVRLYTIDRGGGTLKEQIFATFASPYWPIPIALTSDVECIELQEDMPYSLGSFTIIPFEAPHPNKTTSFYITDGSIRIVYLLDSEISLLDENKYTKLVAFCRNADLVIFDAAYSPEDYLSRKGWGHSTIEDGIKLAQLSGCKRLMFDHFSFDYNDSQIEMLDKIAQSKGDNFIFAREGLEMTL